MSNSFLSNEGWPLACEPITGLGASQGLDQGQGMGTSMGMDMGMGQSAGTHNGPLPESAFAGMSAADLASLLGGAHLGSHLQKQQQHQQQLHQLQQLHQQHQQKQQQQDHQQQQLQPLAHILHKVQGEGTGGLYSGDPESLHLIASLLTPALLGSLQDQGLPKQEQEVNDIQGQLALLAKQLQGGGGASPGVGQEGAQQAPLQRQGNHVPASSLAGVPRAFPRSASDDSQGSGLGHATDLLQEDSLASQGLVGMPGAYPRSASDETPGQGQAGNGADVAQGGTRAGADVASDLASDAAPGMLRRWSSAKTGSLAEQFSEKLSRAGAGAGAGRTKGSAGAGSASEAATAASASGGATRLMQTNGPAASLQQQHQQKQQQQRTKQQTQKQQQQQQIQEQPAQQQAQQQHQHMQQQQQQQQAQQQQAQQPGLSSLSSAPQLLSLPSAYSLNSLSSQARALIHHASLNSDSTRLTPGTPGVDSMGALGTARTLSGLSSEAVSSLRHESMGFLGFGARQGSGALDAHEGHLARHSSGSVGVSVGVGRGGGGGGGLPLAHPLISRHQSLPMGVLSAAAGLSSHPGRAAAYTAHLSSVAEGGTPQHAETQTQTQTQPQVGGMELGGLAPLAVPLSSGPGTGAPLNNYRAPGTQKLGVSFIALRPSLATSPGHAAGAPSGLQDHERGSTGGTATSVEGSMSASLDAHMSSRVTATGGGATANPDGGAGANAEGGAGASACGAASARPFGEDAQFGTPRQDTQGLDAAVAGLSLALSVKGPRPGQGGAHRQPTKGTWLLEEDQVLVAYVAKYGARNWNNLMANGWLNRSGKSCRLRWVNQLMPGLQVSPGPYALCYGLIFA